MIYPCRNGTTILCRNGRWTVSDLPAAPSITIDTDSEPSLCADPPFFAFFERALSIVAFQIHPSIASLSEVTPAAVIFQRGSVIISELVLVAATLR